jgi:hypothetical protein
MWMPWHKARETLAFAKWELDKLLIRLNQKPLKVNAPQRGAFFS